MVHHVELKVRDHGFDCEFSLCAAAERKIVPEAIDKQSYIDLGYDTKLKTMNENGYDEDLRTQDRDSFFCRHYMYNSFASESSGRLFVKASVENVEMKRCYIALDYDTYPHRLLI